MLGLLCEEADLASLGWICVAEQVRCTDAALVLDASTRVVAAAGSHAWSCEEVDLARRRPVCPTMSHSVTPERRPKFGSKSGARCSFERGNPNFSTGRRGFDVTATLLALLRSKSHRRRVPRPAAGTTCRWVAGRINCAHARSCEAVDLASLTWISYAEQLYTDAAFMLDASTRVTAAAGSCLIDVHLLALRCRRCTT